MNNKVINSIIFSLGVIGSYVVGSLVQKNKDKKIYMQDLATTREYYRDLLKDKKVSLNAGVVIEKIEDDKDQKTEVYVESQAEKVPLFELLTEDDYDASYEEFITLTWFANNVLTGFLSLGPVKNEYEKYVGSEAAELLLHGKENYVYVHDMEKDVYYEIVRSDKEYEG